MKLGTGKSGAREIGVAAGRGTWTLMHESCPTDERRSSGAKSRCVLERGIGYCTNQQVLQSKRSLLHICVR